MLRRLTAAVMAALFICGALATPAPSRAQATATPTPASTTQAFDAITVRFAYKSTVGTAFSRDGQTRTIHLQPGQDAETALAAWEQAPGVLAVVPDVTASIVADPVDPLWGAQWDLKSPLVGSEGAAHVSDVWSSVTGAGVVVAIIDTGQTNHPDLVANMPAGWGVDMISNSLISRDGDGRDTNPTDEGDWVRNPSSWHGTHVAGTIGAAQNDIGVSGIAPNVSIMHVRALGAGGGSFYDVIDGIRWAAGLTTSWDGLPWSSFGLPNNAHQADIINLSLGGVGACWSTLQDAISAARAAGTLVVAAAGNSFLNTNNFTPANCDDTVTVAAVGRAGGLASYSNYGSIIDIAAAGGDMSRDSGILSTIATGATTLTGYGYTYYQGTSMATPHVVGVAALVASAHPTWGPAEIEAALYAGARPFPADDLRPCVTRDTTPVGTQRQCGVGILDAVGALNMAEPKLSITAPDVLSVDASATVSAASDLDGAVSLTVADESAAQCTLSGTTLQAIGAGICRLIASTPASITHVAGYATHSITITGIDQSIDFGVGPLFDPETIAFSSTLIPLAATATSGLFVSYQSQTPATCSLTAHDGISDTWRVRLLNVGTCTLRALQAGNARYNPATPVERSFTIVQGSQTIDLGTLSDRAFNPANRQVLPRFSSAGLPLNYAGLTSSVCQPQFTGTNFELVQFSPGTCTIRAEQLGSSTYLAAAPVTLSFTIFKLPQSQIYFDVGGTLHAVNTSGGWGYGGGSTASEFVVTSLTPRTCSVSGRIVNYLREGNCTLRGTKAGDTNYYAASITVRITIFTPARLNIAPRILQIGRVVTANSGTWTGTPTPTFHYQWFSCATAERTGCSAIGGATSSSLTVTSALAGRFAFVRVFMYQAGQERARTDSNVIKLSAR